MIKLLYLNIKKVFYSCAVEFILDSSGGNENI